MSEFPSRRACEWLLAGFGFALAGLTLYHLLVGHADLIDSLVELALLGGLTALVGGMVYRVVRSEIDDDLLVNIVAWCYGGAAFVFVVSIPATFYMGLPFASHDTLFGRQVALSVGGLGGLVAGYHEARMVTEARQSDQTELERDRLEYLNHLLRHDILNNLTVIDGNVELLLEDAERTDRRERLETVHRQTREATEHIQNVRLLVQSVESDLELERIDLAAAVEDELAQLRAAYPDAEITAEGPSEAWVRADALVGSLVENLVRNAVQHNDSATPRVTVGLETDEETVTLRVSDNGPGIPNAVRDSLDQPPGESEHGLGLHLVRALVERYRGSFAIADTAEGSTVAVELQRA